MLNRNGIVAIGLSLTIVVGFMPAGSAGEPGQVRIEWEAVTGAQGYVVEIRNPDGKTIFKKNAAVNFIKTTLAPGDYRIKVSALNVFMKPASSSGWTGLVVKEKEAGSDGSSGGSEAVISGQENRASSEKEALERKNQEELKRQQEALKNEEELKRQEEAANEKARKEEAEKIAREARQQKMEEDRRSEEASKKEQIAQKGPADRSRGLLGLGPLEVAPGAGCQVPVGKWGRYLDISPSGHLSIAYGLSGIPAVSTIPVLSSFGFELKFGVVPFTGRTRNRERMSFLNMTPTAGIFYNIKIATVKQWSFHFRPYFLIGPSFSILETREFYLRKVRVRATNFSYDAHVLFRAAYDGAFFIDAGFGYLSVLLKNQQLHSIYPFVQFGVLL